MSDEVQTRDIIIVSDSLVLIGRQEGEPCRLEDWNNARMRGPSPRCNPFGNEARTKYTVLHDGGAGCVSSDGSSLGRRVVA